MRTHRRKAFLLTMALLSIACAEQPDTQSVSLQEVADDETYPAEGNITDDATLRQKDCVYRVDYRGAHDVLESQYGSYAACPSFCPKNSFVYGVMVWSEKYQGSGDDTALNKVELHCYDRTTGNYRGYVTSKYGPYGDWGTRKTVSDMKDPVVSATIRFEDSQGSGDDTGMNELHLYTKSGVWLYSPSKTHFGNFYSGFGGCAQGTAACGLNTQVEGGQGAGDDTTMNSIQLQCCTF